MNNKAYKHYLIAAIPGIILSLLLFLFFGKLFQGIVNLLLDLGVFEKSDGLIAAILIFCIMVTLTLASSASLFQLLMGMQNKEKIPLSDLASPFLFPAMFLAIPVYVYLVDLIYR